MRVLVTGAAGFIGYHTAKALLARGDEVVGLDLVVASELFGGLGNDVFVFREATFSIETVVDFAIGQDKVEFLTSLVPNFAAPVVKQCPTTTPPRDTAFGDAALVAMTGDRRIGTTS